MQRPRRGPMHGSRAWGVWPRTLCFQPRVTLSTHVHASTWWKDWAATRVHISAGWKLKWASRNCS